MGLQITLSDGGLRILVLFPGAFLLTMFLVVTPFRMWCAQRDLVAEANAKIRQLQSVGSGIEIHYDPEDPVFVRRDTAKNVIWYWVALRNATPETRTLYDVSLRMLPNAGKLITEIIEYAWSNPAPPGLRNEAPLFIEIETLHPDETKYISLFGFRSVSEPSSVEEFTLEARAKDTKTVRAVFEFDRSRIPMLRRIS